MHSTLLPQAKKPLVPLVNYQLPQLVSMRDVAILQALAEEQENVPEFRTFNNPNQLNMRIQFRNTNTALLTWSSATMKRTRYSQNDDKENLGILPLCSAPMEVSPPPFSSVERRRCHFFLMMSLS